MRGSTSDGISLRRFLLALCTSSDFGARSSLLDVRLAIARIVSFLCCRFLCSLTFSDTGVISALCVGVIITSLICLSVFVCVA